VGGEPGGTSGSIHGLGYLFSALSREESIADELVLQLATFLRSLDVGRVTGGKSLGPRAVIPHEIDL